MDSQAWWRRFQVFESLGNLRFLEEFVWRRAVAGAVPANAGLSADPISGNLDRTLPCLGIVLARIEDLYAVQHQLIPKIRENAAC